MAVQQDPGPAGGRGGCALGGRAAHQVPVRAGGLLAPSGVNVIVPPTRWKIVVISVGGIVPLLEAVSYLLAPHLAGLPPGPGR